MLRSILVGLDNSPFSQSAMEWGIRAAKEFNALLVGLGILDLKHIGGSEPVPLGGGAFKKDLSDARKKDAERQIQSFLNTFSQRCVAEQVSYKELQEEGSPADKISLIAQRYDLLVLGQESHFSFETQSSADHTLHDVLLHSPRPVVVVPREYSPGSDVVIAYDGSLQAAHAVHAFRSLELYRNRKVHIVVVMEEVKKAAVIADRVIDYLHFHEVKAEPHAIGTTTRPQDVLYDFVTQTNPELLVMGAYGKMSWREFFFGTVTKKMLNEAPVPMFISH